MIQSDHAVQPASPAETRVKPLKRVPERSVTAPPKGCIPRKDRNLALANGEATPASGDALLRTLHDHRPHGHHLAKQRTPQSRSTWSGKWREGKRSFPPLVQAQAEKRHPPTRCGKQQKPDFRFCDSRGESIAPRVQQVFPLKIKQAGITESVGNVQKVWCDVPRPSLPCKGETTSVWSRGALKFSGETIFR